VPTTGFVLAGLLDCGHVAAYLWDEDRTPPAPAAQTTPFGQVARWEAMTPDEWATAQDAMIAASTLLEMREVPHRLGGMQQAGLIRHDLCEAPEAAAAPAAAVAAAPVRSLADVVAEQLIAGGGDDE
jgi:hypothetical protein